MLNHSEYIKKQKDWYRKIKKIYCPALSCDIHFGNSGFRHIVTKLGLPRPKIICRQRFSLLRRHYKILSDIDLKIVKTRIISRKYSEATFITLEQKIAGTFIKIVTRKINQGPTHFFSIMDRKTKTTRR